MIRSGIHRWQTFPSTEDQIHRVAFEQTFEPSLLEASPEPRLSGAGAAHGPEARRRQVPARQAPRAAAPRPEAGDTSGRQFRTVFGSREGGILLERSR